MRRSTLPISLCRSSSTFPTSASAIAATTAAVPQAKHSRSLPLAASARWFTWANRGLQGAVGLVTIAIGLHTIVENAFA